MNTPAAPIRHDRPGLGIIFVLLGMVSISVNDMLIKQLSDGYPLHQTVFFRAGIGIFFSMGLVLYEGGLQVLRTQTPGLHLIRGLLVVIANMAFFTAIAVAPLAEVTALFFAAPLMITVLSIPLLGERVGPMRMGAVLVGFIGVVVMLAPWNHTEGAGSTNRLVLLLPILSALAYALNQLLTRHLGATSQASAMAVYIQATFIVVSVAFWLVAGDGRYAEGVENPSLQFLFRAWIWPQGTDLWLLIGLGANSAIIGYCLAQGYRLADAATVAPFEYVGLPLAIFWGWLFWAELPNATSSIGIVLIIGSGLFVFLRERSKKRPAARA